MDLLHKKMLHVGDKTYFIASSIEEPYYYVRFHGEIMELSISDTVISYRLKLLSILESSDVVSECIVNKHFRIRSIKNKQHPFIDYKIRGKQDMTDIQLTQHIISDMSKKWLDVSIMQTFETEEQMNDKLDMINTYNIDKLSSRIAYLSNRILRN